MRSCKVLLVLIGLLLMSVNALAQTTLYVDPNFTGTPRNGNPSNPWNSLSDTSTNTPWTVINNALATGNVTVYFAARLSTSDTDNVTSSAMTLSSTQDRATTTLLYLSGNERYNTTTGAATPNWVAYSGNSRYTISSTNIAIDSNMRNVGVHRQSYITIHGFKTRRNGACQILQLQGIDHLTVEYSEWFCDTTSSPGPGMMLGQGANTNASCSNDGNWGRHILIQHNTAHDTFGETIYVNGTTSDPPGSICTSVQTGDDIVIQNNTIFNCGAKGTGDGDCIDIKDGNTNVKILNNQIYYDTNYNAPSSAGSGLGEPCQALTLDSGTLVEGNLFWTTAAPNPTGPNSTPGCMVTIRIAEAWANTVGKADLTIRNNILIAGTGSTWGFACGGCGIGNTSDGGGIYTNVHIYNNSFFGYPNNIVIVGGTVSGTIDIKNNISMNASGSNMNIGSGFTTFNHDFNDFYNSSNGNLSITVAGSNFNNSNYHTSEPNSINANPNFVNTSAPYVDTNFKVQTGSPAISKATNLSSLFTLDYFGGTRPGGTTAWTIGAHEFNAGGGGGCTAFQLVFALQPSNAELGASLGTVAIHIKDSGGNDCTTATNAVTLSEDAASTWGTLNSSSSLTKNASAGVATWNDLFVTVNTGSGAIDATSTGLTGAVSNSITISCTPTKLIFTAQPSSAETNASLGTVTLNVQNVASQRCPAATNAVTLSKHAGATWGILNSSSSLTHSASAGVVSWNDLFVTGNIGSGAIDATSSGLTLATSNSITISCTPTKLAFTVQPSSAIIGASLGSVQVGIQNANSGICVASANAITLSKDAGATWCQLNATNNDLTQNAVSGLVTWADLNVTQCVGAGSLDAAASGFTTIVSNAITIGPVTGRGNRLRRGGH